MDPTYLVPLVLLAALMHATWNAIVKLDGKRLYILSMIDGTAMLFGLCFVIFVPFPSANVWGYLAISILLNIFYRIFLIKAYEKGDFSRVYPIVRGLPPLLVVILSSVFLGEPLSLQSISGVLLISVGVLSLTKLTWQVRRNNVALYSLLSGICIAFYTIADGIAIRNTEDILAYIVWFTVLENLPFPLYSSVFHKTNFMLFLSKSYKMGLFGGINAATGYGIVLWAMTLGPLGAVSALRETSILFASLIGVYFFKESFGRKRFFAALMIVSGVISIQLSNP